MISLWLPQCEFHRQRSKWSLHTSIILWISGAVINIAYIWFVSEELMSLFSLTYLLVYSATQTFSPQVQCGSHVGVQGGSMRLLVGALHPRPVVAAFFVRAVVVGLPAAARRWALADVVILQVHLFRVSGDDGRLWPWGQHVLQFLHMINTHHSTWAGMWNCTGHWTSNLDIFMHLCTILIHL